MRVFALGLLFTAAGCDAARTALDERQAQLDARDAVRRYSDAVAPTLTLQGAWVATMRGLRRFTTPDAIAQHVTSKVQPALAAYVSALESFTPAAPLDAPHQALRQAHLRLGEALTAFASGVTRDTYATHRAALGDALQAFDAAQGAYDTAIRVHYEAAGLTYVAPPALDAP